MRVSALVVIGLLAGCTTGVSEPGFPAAPVRSGELAVQVDDYLRGAEKRGFNGVALVERGGRIVFAKGYGWLNKDTGRPTKLDGVYAIGSVTKQFTAAAVLKLVDQGRISLHDPISKHLADVPPDKRAITVHQLLTHTAGMMADQGECDDKTTRDSFIAMALALPLEQRPGVKYSYSNLGYNLLAALVEHASGRKYEEFLRSEILLPAGLEETGLYLPQWPLERMATGYRNGARWGRFVERFYKQPEWPPVGESGRAWCGRGAGSLHSTLRDMYRWHRALYGTSFLPPELMRAYMAPHVPEEEGASPSSWYAYGLVIAYPNGRRVVTHNGGINDIFFADFVRYPDEDSAYMIFSNSFFESENALELSPGIRNLVKQDMDKTQK